MATEVGPQELSGVAVDVFMVVVLSWDALYLLSGDRNRFIVIRLGNAIYVPSSVSVGKPQLYVVYLSNTNMS